jgi:threonyl-tRNA synthetase
VRDELRRAGVRADLDERSESVRRKIRDAELGKVPYMLVVGDEEERATGASVRRHGEGDLGLMPLGELADRIRSAA